MAVSTILQAATTPALSQESILQALDWSQTYAFLGAIGVIVGVGIALGVLQSRSITNAKEAATAREMAKAAQERAESVERDLADYKLSAARQYAATATIDQMEGRLIQAINRLGDRLDRALDTPRPGSPS